jgi:hypothetical protein
MNPVVRGVMMRRRMRAIPLLITLAASGCVSSSRSGDPFADAADSQRAELSGGRLYRVRLEVVCGGCTVTYSIAARMSSAVPATPVWRATYDRYPRFPEAIRLSATGEVEAVRIFVNGDLVAFQERRAAGTYGTLSVETVVPPETAEPEPDTLDVEGVPAGR